MDFEELLHTEYDHIDPQKVLGPLVWCVDCKEDYYCLRHQEHYSECACPGFMEFFDDESPTSPYAEWEYEIDL